MTAAAADIGEPLMSPAELAAFLGGDINVITLSQWRYRGTGPKFVKTGRYVRYRPEDVREWLSQRGRGQEAAS